MVLISNGNPSMITNRHMKRKQTSLFFLAILQCFFKWFIDNGYDSNKCYPIQIPTNDPFWQGKKTCMDFARSLSAPTVKCALETRQQVEYRVSHFEMFFSKSQKHTRRQIHFCKNMILFLKKIMHEFRMPSADMMVFFLSTVLF